MNQPGKMANLRLRKRGFTLVEVLLVTVVAAILLAIGVGYYRGVIERAYIRETDSIFMQARSGWKALVEAEGIPNPGDWNPNNSGDAASNLAWQKLNMANPFSNTKLNYAYDVWDPAFASSYAPVNQAKNVIVGIRKKPDGTLDFTRWSWMDLDTGEVFRSVRN